MIPSIAVLSRQVRVCAGGCEMSVNSDVTATVPAGGENRVVDLGRIGWLATVVVCLIAVLILALQGYFGYAAVTLAVAISAAINLS
jgi:hypothetical protein